MDDPRVREQYEAYPYPHRDPAEERKRLITGSPSRLAEIRHYILAGRPPAASPFRVLVAGGGTGDGLIMLAQELKDAGVEAELHYVDLSRASRGIAEARAKVRGLDAIVFHTASLFDAGEFGPFDYIDCCGVLHHLPEPQRGFEALAAMLKPEGGLGLMVYGELGRTGVYHAQEMLRMVLGPEDAAADRVALAKGLLAGLPPTNWLNRNPLISDHRQSDAGVYDLLLHAVDRPYRVPELAATAAGAGLRIVSFIEPARYDPTLYLRDERLAARLRGLDAVGRAGFAELLAGNMRKHIAYCVRADNAADTVASPDSGRAIPVLVDRSGPDMARSMPPGAALSLELDGLRLDAPMPPMARDILRLADGRRSLSEIHRAMPGGPDWFAFKAQFDALYRVMNGFNMLLLRYPADPGVAEGSAGRG